MVGGEEEKGKVTPQLGLMFLTTCIFWTKIGPNTKEHLQIFFKEPNRPNSLPSNAGLLTDANLGLLHGGWRRRKGKSYTSIRINDVPNICRPMYRDDKICLIFYPAYD